MFSSFQLRKTKFDPENIENGMNWKYVIVFIFSCNLGERLRHIAFHYFLLNIYIRCLVCVRSYVILSKESQCPHISRGTDNKIDLTISDLSEIASID